MKVDFNNLRIQTANSYARLVKMLQKHTDKDDNLSISRHDTDTLQMLLGQLRMDIGSVCGTFVEGESDFANVWEKISLPDYMLSHDIDDDDPDSEDA